MSAPRTKESGFTSPPGSDFTITPSGDHDSGGGIQQSPSYADLKAERDALREKLYRLEKVWVEYVAEGDWKLLIDELTEKLERPK